MSFIFEVLGATLRNATPLIFGTVGETYAEKAGVLNLGIEGTMYAGAFFGFAAAVATGSLGLGILAAILVGLAAGAVMAFFSVTLGTSQHVAGIGLTLGLIGISEFVNRLYLGGSGGLRRIEPYRLLEPFGSDNIFSQYGLTYVAFLFIAPLGWWVLRSTSFGLGLRAVGENPEAADAAGLSVAGYRYAALMIGGALMAVGGAFFTLASLGTFTLDIIAGRGWVCIALVIFGRWKVWRGVVGALVFAAVFSLQFRLRILSGWEAVPFELLLALPYLIVIAALAVSGRNVAYPGGYLKHYRRD